MTDQASNPQADVNPGLAAGGLIASPADAAFKALTTRRSHSRVTDEAPTSEQLGHLLSAVSSVADHSGLRPWRIIELRDDARKRLGEGLAQAANREPRKYIERATRAPLVLAIVVSPRPSKKVPLWEQEAVASGVAHYLELLLHEAGWGSIWRTGPLTRTKPVHEAHELDESEYLLGWLYVGGIRDASPAARKPLDLAQHLTSL